MIIPFGKEKGTPDYIPASRPPTGVQGSANAIILFAS